PHLTLTYAQSLDSQLSLAPGMQTLLSGPETKGMTHFLRTRHDAILVGAGTALADDPGLNSRFESVVGEGLENQPIPVVLDFQGLWRPREGLRVFTLARQGLGRAPWWVVGAGAGAGGGDVDAGVEAVEAVGGRVLRLERRKDWKEILGVLAECGVRSVMVEGGASVINGLLEERNQRFVSSVIITIAPTYLGEGGVVVLPKRTGEGNAARLSDARWLPVGEDVVMAGRLVTRS
ncbi:dihydrofolate reductase-like domain-containing protein, partial [Bisporella sp. PMI_857]